MAYSFVKVGSSGKDCDIIAQTTEDKLYFAGEVSGKQFILFDGFFEDAIWFCIRKQ